MFTKLAGDTSKYLSTFIMDLTILFLAKLIETGSEIVGNCRGNCTGFHLSINVVTRSVSPLRIIYGVVSNPCVSIYIIRGHNYIATMI